MHLTLRPRLAMGAAIAGMTMLASVFVAAGTSSAYPDDVGVSWQSVNTNTCNIVDENDRRLANPYWRNGYCYGYDLVDGTWWQPDSGGIGAKWVIHNNGPADWVGKIEWHPYGEHLWIYDLKNDGDSFYVTLSVPEANYSRTFQPPGTSDPVDIGHWNLDFAEGLDVYFLVYDDAARTDSILSGWAGTT